jgi:hypothetical protein
MEEQQIERYFNTYDFRGYENTEERNKKEGVSYLLTGEYELVSRQIFKDSPPMWLYYNYISRINISFEDCQKWMTQAIDYFRDTLPIPIYLLDTPKAKDGRSYAKWAQIPRPSGKFPNAYFYKDSYWINEIGMVSNKTSGSRKGEEGWGDLFKERKTGLLVPAFAKESFHFTTLIHEFAHCLDFQTQLTKDKGRENIIVKVDAVADEVDLQEQDEYFDKEITSLENNIITTHKSYFIDALIRVLRACSDGSIPISQDFDRRAILVQKTLSGVYGDKLLEQRKRQKKEEYQLKKADELREGKRYGWTIPWNKTIQDYLNQNNKENSLSNRLRGKRQEFTLSEIIHIDNLLNKYIDEELVEFATLNPNKANIVASELKSHKSEANRIINNHYENIKSGMEYPMDKSDKDIVGNCDINSFNFYKDWKQCVKGFIKKRGMSTN